MAKTAAEVYEERGRREGRIEGRKEGQIEGQIEGQRRTLLHQMRQKFGALPDTVVAKVDAIRTVAQLDRLSERILTASSLEEMRLAED